MIGYVTIGTNDLQAAGKFYDELFGLIGASRFMQDDHIILWGKNPNEALFSVITPNDKNAATVGNGTMVAFKVDNFEMVKKMHTKALELGGKDEGQPGPRGEIFNFAYARDLEGNKMAFYCKQ